MTDPGQATDTVSYAAGDPVVHRHHGPGTVVGVRTRDLGAGPVEYVDAEFDNGTAPVTVSIPAASLGGAGYREPATRKKVDEAFGVLSGPAGDDPGHRVRRKRDSGKLATGDLVEAAEVVRDLHQVVASRDRPRDVPRVDRAMFDDARRQLAAEFAVVLGVSEDDALARIDGALRSASGRRPLN